MFNSEKRNKDILLNALKINSSPKMLLTSLFDNPFFKDAERKSYNEITEREAMDIIEEFFWWWRNAIY